jgi:hypothetical protein
LLKACKEAKRIRQYESWQLLQPVDFPCSLGVRGFFAQVDTAVRVGRGFV